MSANHPDTRTKMMILCGYLPQRRRDDVIVVGHPRSGTTWLRTMMTNALVPEAESDPDVFNRVIPGISVSNLFGISRLPSPRFLSSHTSFFPGLPRVIYVVRDGRDALVSFYRYTTKRKKRMSKGAEGEEIGFPEFFQRYYRGEYHSIWHHHVESWLDTGREVMGGRLLVVRFEEMKADPVGALGEVMRFSGKRFDKTEIERAVEQTDLDKVREIEKRRWQEMGLGGPDKDSSFYGRGKSGTWEEYFTDEMMDEFLELSRRALDLGGYA